MQKNQIIFFQYNKTSRSCNLVGGLKNEDVFSVEEGTSKKLRGRNSEKSECPSSDSLLYKENTRLELRRVFH